MHRLLINLTMQRPILRLMPHPLRPPLQQNRRIRLGNGKQSHDPKERTNNQRNPSRPSPSKVATRDELPDNRSSDRSYERCSCEAGRCDSSIDRVPEINVGAPNDSDGRRAETTTEEAAYHYGGDIGGGGDGDFEDREEEETEEEGLGAAVDLGKRAPEEGAWLVLVSCSR